MSSSGGPNNRKLNGDARSMSSTLLGRLRERQPAAWERLCQVYGPLVYAWCRRGGLQDDVAADVMQEVFQSVAGGINAFRRDRPGDSFTAWLATITRNKIRDHFRRQATSPDGAAGGTDFYEQMQNIPAPADAEGSSVSLDDRHSVVHRALNLIRGDFEPHTWQAFWQTTVEQRKPADVAADLGMKVNAVYNAKRRVLHRLRDEFEGLLDS